MVCKICSSVGMSAAKGFGSESQKPYRRSAPTIANGLSINHKILEPLAVMSHSIALALSELNPQTARKAKVLLVDDDRSVRQSLGLALQSENFQVVMASNGQEALEKYFDGYIDLVLLDLNMPVKNGWDTFERLTALNPYLAIVLITARLNQRELAAVAGASAIMEKPLNLPILVQVLNRLADESLEER